ncbi:MAG: ribonuclease Z [Thermomicrobiales bacterium]|nr:ribonuclease Z [Thermomicrobiales bacterium]
MIDLLLLGTGGMMPMPNRWLSSLLMRIEGDLVLFDCGEGTQIPWQLYGWGFRRVGTICLSHLHADHVAGIPGLLHAIANAGRQEPVTLFGPPGTVHVVQALREIAPVLGFELRIREIDDGVRFALPGGAEGSVIRGDHALPLLCYRIDMPRGRRFLADEAAEAGIPQRFWSALQKGTDVEIDGRRIPAGRFLGPERKGLSIGFVTDTRPVPNLPGFLRGVDLLVCEGTYGDSADQHKAIDKKHMTFAEAATLAADAQAGALWLTHFSPAVNEPHEWLHNATAIFPTTTIGYSGMEASLAFPSDQD